MVLGPGHNWHSRLRPFSLASTRFTPIKRGLATVPVADVDPHLSRTGRQIVKIALQTR